MLFFIWLVAPIVVHAQNCIEEFDPSRDYFPIKLNIDGVEWDSASFALPTLGTFHLCGSDPPSSDSIEVPIRNAHIDDRRVLPFFEVFSTLESISTVDASAETWTRCDEMTVGTGVDSEVRIGSNGLDLIAFAEDSDSLKFTKTMYMLMGMLFTNPNLGKTLLQDLNGTLRCMTSNLPSISVGLVGGSSSLISSYFNVVNDLSSADVILDVTLRHDTSNDTFDEWKTANPGVQEDFPAMRNKKIFKADKFVLPVDPSESANDGQPTLLDISAEVVPHIVVADVASIVDTQRASRYERKFFRNLAYGDDSGLVPEGSCLDPSPSALESVCNGYMSGGYNNRNLPARQTDGLSGGGIAGIVIASIIAVLLVVSAVIFWPRVAQHMRKKRLLRRHSMTSGASLSPTPMTPAASISLKV